MGPTTTIDDRGLRRLINEALSGPAVVNPVVDPSKAVTDPVNPNFEPHDKVEFGVAVGRLVRNLPDTDMPALYALLQKAIDGDQRAAARDAEVRSAAMGGNQEAIDDLHGTKHEGVTMTKSTVEESLRRRIRAALQEMTGQDQGDQEAKKAAEDAAMAAAELPARADIADIEADNDEDEAETNARAAQPRRGAYKSTAIGSTADVGGMNFDDIGGRLASMGYGGKDGERMSVAGVKQLVDKAMLRFGYLYKLPPDDLKEMIGFAAGDFIVAVKKGKVELSPHDEEEAKLAGYVELLQSSGELTHDDVVFLNDHPNAVKELDGFKEFANDPENDVNVDNLTYISNTRPAMIAAMPSFREFFSSTVKRMMKGGQVLEDPLGEATVLRKRGSTPPPQQFNVNSVMPPADDKHPHAKSSSAPGHKTAAKGLSGDDIQVDWGGLGEQDGAPPADASPEPAMAEGRGRGRDLLAEGLGIVGADTRGPYLVMDGVEVRPGNPNRTQYRPGTKVKAFRGGRRGVFIVEMPNGERWTNASRSPSKRSVGTI